MGLTWSYLPEMLDLTGLLGEMNSHLNEDEVGRIAEKVAHQICWSFSPLEPVEYGSNTDVIEKTDAFDNQKRRIQIKGDRGIAQARRGTINLYVEYQNKPIKNREFGRWRDTHRPFIDYIFVTYGFALWIPYSQIEPHIQELVIDLSNGTSRGWFIPLVSIVEGEGFYGSVHAQMPRPKAFFKKVKLTEALSMQIGFNI